MHNTVVTPLKDEHKEGWTIIHNDNGSSVLTKDGEHYYMVNSAGCSCGHRICIHQKLVYPTSPTSPTLNAPHPPKPPRSRNPNVDIKHGHPAGELDEPKERWIPKTDNSILLGLLTIAFVLSWVLRTVGGLLVWLGNLIDFRNPSELDTEID